MITNTQVVVALIDRSGSMAGKEDDTIGGINTMLNQLRNDKKDNEEILITIKLFDHELITLIENKKINEIQLLDKNDFKPRGQTALVDSLGLTLQEMISKKKTNILSFNSCLIYVCTDGLENASHSYSKNDVKRLITDASKENINVVYLGANQNAFLEAETLGIDLNGVMNYDECPDTVQSAYTSVAQLASRTRSLGAEVSFTKAERQSSVNNKEPIYSKPPLVRRQTDFRPIPPPPITRRNSYT